MSSCRECSRRHNTLCHPRSSKDSGTLEVSGSQSQVDNGQSLFNIAVHHASSDEKGRCVLMATAILAATHRNGSSVPIRVLLDSASEANFIAQSTHNRLGLKRNRTFETVTGLNEIENTIHSTCDVHARSQCFNFEINARCLVVPKITGDLPSIKIDRDALQLPANNTLTDANFHVQSGGYVARRGILFRLVRNGQNRTRQGQFSIEKYEAGLDSGRIHPISSVQEFGSQAESNKRINLLIEIV